MSGTHTCSYSCERPECIKAQRDELVVRLEAQRDQASGSAEYLAYLEAAVDEAGFVIKHDGGTLGNSNFRLELKTPPAVAQANLCRCIDCGGYELTHSSDCTNMAELYGTPAAHEMEED